MVVVVCVEMKKRKFVFRPRAFVLNVTEIFVKVFV